MTVTPPAPARPARRPSRPGRIDRVAALVGWAALVVFLLAGVGGSLTGARVFLGTDALETFEPWRSQDPAPEVVTNPWVGDTLDAVVPRTVFVARSLRAGDLAQWNPWVAGGTPAAPLPDNAPFSPLSLPWYLLPAVVAPAAVKVLEVVTIAAGMVLLCRRLRLPGGAAAIGSLVYASSGFMIAWTNWTQTRVAAFVPLLFWAVDRAVVRRRPRDVVPIAAVVAAMLAGGFPAVTGWALYFAGAWAVVRALALRPGPRAVVRAGVIAALGVVAGAAVLAWQLVPFVQRTLGVVDLAARAQEPQDHLEWTTMASAVVPGILGGPTGPRAATIWNPIENFSYVGAAAVVLGLVGLVAWRPHPGLAGVKGCLFGSLAVCVLLVYGGGPLLGLVQHLPVFENNMVGRMRVLVGFFAALAAAVGYAAVLRRWAARPPARARSPRWPAAVRSAAAVVVAVGAVAVVLRVLAFLPPERRSAMVPPTLLAGALAAATVVLVLLARRRRWGAAAFALVVPVLVAAPAVGVARTWWPQGDPDMLYPRTSTHRFLEANLGHDRYITVDQTMLPGSSPVYGLRSADGHAFHSPQWRELLHVVDPDVAWGSGDTYTSLRSADLAAKLDSPVLDRIGVRYVTVPPAVEVPGVRDAVAPPTSTTTLEPGGGSTPATRLAGPVRGVFVELPEGLAVGPEGAVVTVEVTRADGSPVTATPRALAQPLPAGGLWVALAAEDVGPDEPVDVTVRVAGDTGPVVVATASGGGPALTAVRPADDDLTVVDADGVTLVERGTALPRLRWAGSEQVAAGSQERLAVLASDGLADGTVVLEHPGDARGTSGAAGTVEVVRDAGDTVEVAVHAEGDGWLVVADAMQGSGGWRATVDGEPAPIVEAEHAGGAVFVTAGDHDVRLTYSMPGVAPGALVAVLTVLALVATWLLDRRRGRPAAARATGGADRPTAP